MANFDATRAIFNQLDANKDGTIDRGEFTGWAAGGGGGAGGLSSSSSFESSSFQSSAGGFDGSAGGAFGAGAAFGGAGGFESAYSSQSGFESAGGAESAFVAGASGGSTFESSSVEQSSQYASAGGLFNDPNPQIIRRAAAQGPVTYTQNIRVRFLQPPPVPPPGPLIIKEVRPPQPPPPPPLVVRQRAPPLPNPPPLILRERPPVPPAVIASQTVVRRLAAIPVPPRSVIIERLPPLPPRPRDIVIERWVQYGAQAKRRTIVQRAGAAVVYPRPRNVIVVYDAVQARIVRQFQRLGVTAENPQAYVSRYGASLLDGNILVQQARAAGVVEDISPPAAAASFAAFGASSYGADFTSSTAEGGSGLEGLQVIGGAEAGTYGLSVANDAAGGYSSQSFSSSSYGAEGGFGGGAGFDLASASFASADSNRDGSLDQAEFQRFVQGGL